MPIGAREHLCQAVLIVFRDGSNRDAVKVNAVLVIKRTTLKGQVYKLDRCFTRRKLDHVQVGSGTFEPVELRHDKTTNTIHLTVVSTASSSSCRKECHGFGG